MANSEASAQDLCEKRKLHGVVVDRHLRTMGETRIHEAFLKTLKVSSTPASNHQPGTSTTVTFATVRIISLLQTIEALADNDNEKIT